MMTQRITLQSGDYVATADIKDDAEYHAIAKAFMEAGCKDWPEYHDKSKRIQGWSALFGRYGWDSERRNSFARQLTPAQILATSQWVPEVGDHVVFPTGRGVVRLQPDVNNVVIVEDYNDGYKRVAASACKPLPTEEDRAVDEMVSDLALAGCEGMAMKHICKSLHAAGYRKQPQPAEDIDFNDPANWRAGNVVKVIKSDCGLNFGQGYFFIKHDDYGSVIVEDEKGKQYRAPAKSLRFHSIYRP